MDVRPSIPEVAVVEVADNPVNGLVEVELNEGVPVNDITLHNDTMNVVPPLHNEVGHVIMNVVELGVDVSHRDVVLVSLTTVLQPSECVVLNAPGEFGEGFYDLVAPIFEEVEVEDGVI
ncbi:hypothetical protein MA16_Dca012521 [Dendrobium catenatum]|uniref:Uncharacterized protein n=1 Tax=Dendrobium catenatum TaxID=906689 RepID=A0A2I0W539_9ASPA|nr:hypothetical protein MA16_Dca012521 [Dendrobium catenatum]